MITWYQTNDRNFVGGGITKIGMERRLFNRLILIVLGLFPAAIFAACNSGNLELAVSPSATTEIPPSSTYSLTPTPMATSSTEPTRTPTPTPTPEPVFLTIKEASFCRQGPGGLYPILDFLEVDYKTEVIGVGDLGEEYGTQVWYVVIGPISRENCWVYGNLVELSSEDDGITLMAAPPTRTPEPAPTINPNGVVYYLILLDTGGPFACGDSLIPVNSGIKKTGDVEQDIINALNALFSLKSEYSGNLYNALYKSNLKAKRVEMSGSTATVYTRGTVVKPKDDCDKERFRLQVFVTVESFGQVSNAIIYANNALLGDLLEQGNK